MTAEKAKEHGLKPLATVKAFGIGGADPTLTYPAVPIAVTRALDKAGLNIRQMDLIEIQEAFAVQTIADARLMGLSESEMVSKVNVNGSGISLGHPIGATGVMRLVTLVHEMNRRNSKYGLLTICGGGGLGIGAIVIAHPPHAMAFGVVDAELNSRTIPESYVVLRGIPRLTKRTPVKGLGDIHKNQPTRPPT
jgi:acetyl-CoA C-acetyltransferase